MTSMNSNAVVLVDCPHAVREAGRRSLVSRCNDARRRGAARRIAPRRHRSVRVEHVIFGEVLQAGVGQNPARQVLFKTGLAKTTTAETVNKVCASGLLAVASAMRLINAGANRVVAAGGMESMSNAPYLLDKARIGYRFGDGTLIDAMIHDGLWDQYFPMTMSTQGSIVANELGMTREEQDRFAYESHRRATRRMKPASFAR